MLHVGMPQAAVLQTGKLLAGTSQIHVLWLEQHDVHVLQACTSIYLTI